MTIDATSKTLGLPRLTPKRVVVSGLIIVAIPLVISFAGAISKPEIGTTANAGSTAEPGGSSTKVAAITTATWSYDRGTDMVPVELADAVAADNPDSPLPKASTWVSASSQSINAVPSHQGDTQESAFLQFHIAIEGPKKEYSASILTGIPVDCDNRHPVVAHIDGARTVTWRCSSFPVVVFDDGAAVLRDVEHASRIDIELPRQNPERRINFHFAVDRMKPESAW